MTDYISRAEAIERMSGSNIENHLDSELTSEPRRYARAAQRVIWSVPAADVVPVVHGRWITRKDVAPYKPDGEITSWTYYCSECGEKERLKRNFCPNCGAKMDGGEAGCDRLTATR